MQSTTNTSCCSPPQNASHRSSPLRSSSINVALRNSVTAARASSGGAAAVLSRHCSGSLSPRVPPPAAAATLRRMRSISQHQAMPPQLHSPMPRMVGSNSGSSRGDIMSQRRQTASGNGRGPHAATAAATTNLPSSGGRDVSVDAVKRIRRRPEIADTGSGSSDGGGGGGRAVTDGSSDCESGGGGDDGLIVRPSVSGTSGLPSSGLPSHGAAADGGLPLSRRPSYQTSLSSHTVSRHRAAALSPVARAATTTSVEQYDERHHGSAAAAVPAKRLSSYGSSQAVYSAASVRSAAIIGSQVAAAMGRQAGAVRLPSSPQVQVLASPQPRLAKPAVIGGGGGGGGNSLASPGHGSISRAGSQADMGQGRGSVSGGGSHQHSRLSGRWVQAGAPGAHTLPFLRLRFRFRELSRPADDGSALQDLPDLGLLPCRETCRLFPC